MKIAWLAMLAVAGCYHGAEGRGLGLVSTSDADDETSADTAVAAESESSDGDAAEAGDASSGGSDGDAAPGGGPGLAADEFECVGTMVFEQTGVVLEVPAEGGELELVPLAAGEGFSCMRVEFDLDVAAIPAAGDDCPVYAAIASIRGTAAGGEDMAAAYVHPYELGPDGCTRGADRLAVGNFRELRDDEPAPPMSGTWRARLLVQPFVSRFEVLDADDHPIASVSANLFPASIADTRDPVVRLGLGDPIGETLVPWGPLVFRDVRIFAQVALAE